VASVIAGVVSAFLWLAAIFCLPSVFRGRRRLLFSFLAIFALTMSLQTDVVFDSMNSALGGANVTYFIFHATAIISVALLNELVRAATSASTGPINPKAAIFPTAIVVIQAALFFGSDWRFVPDIRFLDRWDYTLYAATTWVALGYFSVTVAAACVADLRRQDRRVTRVSLGFVILGCAGVLVYAIVSLTDAATVSLNHNADFSNWSRPLYYGALFIAPVSLAVGLGLTAVVDAILKAGRGARNRWILWRLTPLWERLLASSPQLTLDQSGSRISPMFGRGAEARLYRRYVEIRDSLMLYPLEVSASDLALLDIAERHTSQIGAGRAYSTVTAPTGTAPVGTAPAGDERIRGFDSPRPTDKR
jgi:hypothetical protein